MARWSDDCEPEFAQIHTRSELRNKARRTPSDESFALPVGPDRPCQLIPLKVSRPSGTLMCMACVFRFLLSLLTCTFRSRLSLQLEIAALRHQLSAYRLRGRRPRIAPPDRLLWSVLAKLWSQWRSALFFVQPRTVTLWQQKRFRDYWRALSQQGLVGRPQIPRELRQLIRRMWQANPAWGSPRIVAELHKLGIEVAKSTVEKYTPPGERSPSSTWLHEYCVNIRDAHYTPPATCQSAFTGKFGVSPDFSQVRATAE